MKVRLLLLLSLFFSVINPVEAVFSPVPATIAAHQKSVPRSLPKKLEHRTNGWAVAAFVSGLLCIFPPLPLLFAPLAILFGVLALARKKPRERALAIAGMVLAVLSSAALLIWLETARL